MIRITPPPAVLRITPPPLVWGQPVERETRNRILVSVYAYAYEFEDSALITDAEYDRLARIIDPAVTTGNAMLDKFFREHYTPDTGMWIRLHPELEAIQRIYRQYYIR